MTVTIVETHTQARAVTGGVDTRADVHVAAALDPAGGLLGVQEFPASPAGWVSAARAAQSGRAAGAPKGRDGQVEAIRALMVARRTARSERIQTIGQARALIVTGPDDLRARFARRFADDLVAELASLRPRPGSMIRYHTLLSLRELGRRVAFPGGRPQRLDALIVPLVTARAPGLLALYCVGHDTAAKLLIAAGDPAATARPTTPCTGS